MRPTTLSLLGVIAGAALTAQAQGGKPSACNWRDVTRDIYIEAVLDRAAQVLTCDSPRRIAVTSPGLNRIVVLDLGANTVNLAAKEQFRFAPDRASATSGASLALEAAGKYTAIDNYTYLFAAQGKSILIRQHPGVTGEISEEKLWETVPVWRALMDNYQPDEAAVKALGSTDSETSVTVVFGSWCPDSKNYVPKLLKALKAASSDKIRVKLVGVDNQFREPVDTVQPRRIINVPTVIVERSGNEIGRIVETPAGPTIEEDLAAITSGKPLAHKGRWERGPEVARGAYSFRDRGGKPCGSETWEMYSTSEGGYLLHSLVELADSTAEVFYRVNKDRKPTFVEITRRRDNDISRARFTIEDHTMTVRSRGNLSGIVQQTVEVPKQLIFLAPAVAASGWVCPQSREPSRCALYRADAERLAPVGTLDEAKCEVAGDETVRVQAGEFRAKRISRLLAGERSDWWLHEGLGFPVRGRIMDGLEYVLTSLRITSATK
jgi:hypothetical protein